MEKFNYQSVLLICGLGVWLAACSQNSLYDENKATAVKNGIANTSPIARANALTDIMTTTLNLSDTQQRQVSALNLEYSTRFNVLANSRNPSINKQAEFQRLSKEKEARIKTLLTVPQLQAYDANRAALLDTYRIM
jgi:hypothetical protein